MSLLLAVLLAQATVVQQGKSRDGGIGWAVEAASGSGLVTQPAPYNSSAFGAMRTAQQYRLADLINAYSLDTDVYGLSLDGGCTITHLPTESAIHLVAPDAGGFCQLQTHDHYRYQAGAGARIYQTLTLPAWDGGAVAVGTTRWGQYDSNDGWFWERSPSGLRFAVRSSTDGGVTDTYTAVDAGTWNPAMGSIWETSYQWLGVGVVRGFLNGVAVTTRSHPNTLPYVYMRTANLPLTWEARDGAEMKVICANVQSEGGSTPPSLTYATRRTGVAVGNAATHHMVSLRPGLGNAFSAQEHARLWPTSIACASTTQRARVDLWLRPSGIDGASFVSAGSGSVAEVAFDAGIPAGGQLIGTFSIPAGGYTDHDLRPVFGELTRSLRRRAFATSLDAGYDLQLDTISVTCTNTTAVSTDCACYVDWQELK